MSIYFHETSISNYNNFSDYFSDNEHLCPENVFPACYEIEPTFRCASMNSMEENTIGRFNAAPTTTYQKWDQTKRSAGELDHQSSTKILTKDEKKHYDVPSYLFPTNFEISFPLSEVFAKVSGFFGEVPGLSFQTGSAEDSSFCAKEWNAIYLSGWNFCKFQIHVYSKSDSIFIVECNRLSGDSCLFRSIFSQLRSCLAHDLVTPISPISTVLFHIDQENGACCAPGLLEPILRMAREQTAEAQLEASRVLCCLSLDETMTDALCESGCVDALTALTSGSLSEWAKQHAISALANLSVQLPAQETMIQSGALTALFPLVVDGPADTIEKHVLAAFVLANLCRRLAPLVVTTLGREQVESWLLRVDSLQDTRLQLHAQRARDSLLLALALSSSSSSS